MPGANDTGAAYELTETERATATNVLVNLLFTVVETPTREDRRRADREAGARDDGASDDTPDDTDSEESPDFELTGYAGPE